MRNGMARLHRVLRMSPVLLLGVLPLAAQSPDLEMTCRPEHGLLDLRQERPAEVRHHSPFSTWNLFDNPQLFEVRVALTNLGPDRRRVSDGDWASTLQVRVWRDGAELGPDEIRIEPAQRLLGSRTYLKDGRPVEEMRFRRRSTAPGSEPLMPYDEVRREEKAVEELPQELATYEAAVVILRLRAADGGDLPLGLYTLSVADESNRDRCYGEQLVVLRAPQSPLDIVSAHIVRANAYEAQGDMDAAADELARATELAPDNLEGWVRRSALAFQRNDLAGQAEAATRLEALIAAQVGLDEAASIGGKCNSPLQDATAVARRASELRRRVAAGKSGKP